MGLYIASLGCISLKTLDTFSGGVLNILIKHIHSTFARLGTDYEMRNQCFFAILKAMTTG